MRDEQEKKIADKGWQSMQQLLERDLPTERKRRPIAWWWFGLLLLPLAILGGKAWWQSDNIQPVAPAQALPTVERPIVQQTSPVEAATVAPGQTPAPAVYAENTSSSKSAETKHTSTALTIKSPSSRPATASPTAGAITEASPGTPAISQTGTTETTQASSDASPLNADHITLADTDAQQSIASTSSEHDVATTDVPSALHANDLEFLALPFPAIQKGNTLSIPTLEVPITVAKTSIHPQKKHANWSVGLTASIATERFASLNAVSGGATMDWRLTRKWGLRSGLLYTRYLPTSSRQPVVAVKEVSYTNATGLYTGNNLDASLNPVSNELLEGYVYIPLRKLHQIEMPVMLWFEPVKRLRLYSGIAVDYTFMGQSAKQNYIDNEIVALDTQTKQRGASRVATNELQRWQLHYMGGIGIGLGRHAELSAYWHSPIRNIFTQKTGLASFNSSTEQFDATFSNASSSSPLPQLGRFVLQGIWFF